LPPAARKKTLASLNFEQRTPHTITDIARMEGELDRIAEQGYALDESEFVEGMNAIAVPVRDPNGRFYAALAVHGPDQRLTMQAAMAHHPMLIEASKRISTALFG
jgi:DNA-binding IclR family transcriptional regulator